MLVLGQGRRMGCRRLLQKPTPLDVCGATKRQDGPRARGHISQGINFFLAGHSCFLQMCWRYRRPALQEENWWEKLLEGIEGWCSPSENAPETWGVWSSWAHSLWKQSLIPAPAFLYKELRFGINWIPFGQKDPPSTTPRNINQEISSLQRASAEAFPLFAAILDLEHRKNKAYQAGEMSATSSFSEMQPILQQIAGFAVSSKARSRRPSSWGFGHRTVPISACQARIPASA